jgi:hypothetical protein
MLGVASATAHGSRPGCCVVTVQSVATVVVDRHVWPMASSCNGPDGFCNYRLQGTLVAAGEGL